MTRYCAGTSAAETRISKYLVQDEKPAETRGAQKHKIIVRREGWLGRTGGVISIIIEIQQGACRAHSRNAFPAIDF